MKVVLLFVFIAISGVASFPTGNFVSVPAILNPSASISSIVRPMIAIPGGLAHGVLHGAAHGLHHGITHGVAAAATHANLISHGVHHTLHGLGV